jgi:putative oxidoreductase
MKPILGRFQSCVYGVFRIVAGYAFMLHGAQKLFGVLGTAGPVDFLSLMGLAGAIEFCGGALIAVGLFTSPVAFLASGQMAFAYFMGHVARSGGALFPVTNQGEAAVLYCFIFLYLAAKGTGPFGLDGLRTTSPQAGNAS